MVFIEFMCVDPSFGVLSLATHPWVGASSSIVKKSSLCFLRSLFHASNMAAEGLGAAGDDGEEEQEIHYVDLVIISYICRGVFISLGCIILLM